MPSLAFHFGKVPDVSALCIDSPRLRLRALAPCDAEDIFREFTPQITRYMMPKPAQVISETLAFITGAQQSQRDGNELIFAITRRRNGEFMGCCGIHGRGNAGVPELGIWVKASAHGHRYGREAAASLARWACGVLDTNCFHWPVDRVNIASRRIPELLGGQVVAEKRVLSMSGTLLDEVVYAIPAGGLMERAEALLAGFADDRGD